MYKMREGLAKAGLIYVDKPEDVTLVFGFLWGFLFLIMNVNVGWVCYVMCVVYGAICV